MRLRTLVSAIVALLVVAQLGAAQSAPDFSGDWILVNSRSSQTMRGAVVVSVTGLLGDKFTAKQDAKTLTLDITSTAIGRPVRAVYNLDGSESRNLNPGAPDQPDEPIFSRASWEAETLVIVTRGTALVNGKPLETKRVIWIDNEGFLTIERSAADAPTTRSVYRRAG